MKVTRSPRQRRWRMRRLLPLLTVGSLVIPLLLAAVPATADPEPDPHEQHDQYVEQYGDIGCSVVPGFNDRCPSMISEPYHPPVAVSRSNVSFRHSVVAPDGNMLYAAGWQRARVDDDSTVTEAVVAGYHTTPGDPSAEGTVAWTRSFVQEDSTTETTDIEISPDGRHVFVTGVHRPNPRSYVPYEGWVAALDTATGAVVWKRSIRDLIGSDAQLIPGVPGNPWIEAFEVVASPDSSRVVVSAGVIHPFGDRLTDVTRTAWNAWYFVLNIDSGELDWKHQYTERAPASVGIKGDALAFAPDGSHVYAQLRLTNRLQERIGIGTIALDTMTGEIVWDEAYLYPSDDRYQNPPAGLIVDPTGDTVVAAGTHWYPDPETGDNRGNFLLVAYDATDGEHAWTAEFPATHTACDHQVPTTLTPGRSLVASPSGDLVYLVGQDGDDRGGCTWWDAVLGARIFAVQTETGRLIWDELLVDPAGMLCLTASWCDVAIVPGPPSGAREDTETGGDKRDLLIHSADFARHGNTSWYPLVTALDARTGKRVWQARYLDTHSDGNTQMNLRGSPVATSGEDARVYTMLSEWSQARGWQVNRMLVLGYEVWQADLSLTADAPSDPATAGESLTYTFSVANNGPDNAGQVTWTGNLPDSVDVASVESSQGTCSETATVVCDLGELPGGESVTVRLAVTPQSSGVIKTVAALTSATADPDEGNNRAEVATVVRR